MASITWDAIGSRTYEGGIDKGVLYLTNGTAVPWNGLVSITEKANRSTTPMYFDGRKVLDLVEVGDFEATLEAITYPDEVLVLEGLGKMQAGVYVGDQSPQLFHLSYKTNIGTDTLGRKAYYQLHILYNVTAIPSDKEYATFSDDAEPMTFSWDISAIPEEVPGFRPSAHIVLDSRFISPFFLKYVEDILYGTSLTSPSIPAFEDLMREIVDQNPVFAPPAVKVAGDTWMASNGHKAIFNGSTWSAVYPTTGVNIAVLLGNATFLIDATKSTAGEQVAVNLGVGGPALNARYGSTTGVDTNDPLFLPHAGENYVYFPGAANNNVATPFVAYNQTGDVEIVVQTKGINWSDASRANIAGSWDPGFLIDKFNVTQLLIVCSNSSGNCFAFPAHGLTGVVDQWFRFVYQKSSGTWTAFKGTDGSLWTDITAATNTPSPGVNLPNGTTETTVGGNNATGWLSGRVPFFQMRAGISGTPFLTYREAGNVTLSGQLSWTDGVTWTVNRSATGRKTDIVTRPIWLLGTDDYLNVPDNALLNVGATDSFTLMSVSRSWGTGNSRIAGKISTRGFFIDVNLTSLIINTPLYGTGGTPVTGALALGVVSGALVTSAMIRNVGSTNITAVFNNTFGTPQTDTTTGAVTDTQPFRVGEGSGVFADAEIGTVALWRKALTAPEITALNTYLQAGPYQ